MNNNFAFHESLLILAMCLGDLCVAINSPGKPAIHGSEHTDVWSYIKRLKSEVQSSHQMPDKVVWPKKTDLFSSIDLPCMWTQWRILAVYVSLSALQSIFTEQFFSKSWFTDTKNGWSQHHKNKLAPPPTPSLKLIQSSCLAVKGIGCCRTLSESYIKC